MCWASPVRNEQYQYVLVAISFGGGALFHNRPDPSFRNNKSCQGTGIPGSHGMEGKSPEALPQTWSSFQMVKATPTKWKARLYCSTVSPYKPKSWDQRYNTSQTQCKAIIVLVGDVMPPEISTQQLAPFQLTYEALRCFTYRTWKRYRDTTFQLWNSWNSLNHGILVQFHDDDSSYPGWVKYDSMTHWLISCNGNLQRKTLEEKKITCQIHGSKKWSPHHPQLPPCPSCRFPIPPPSFQSRSFCCFSLARLRGSTPGNAKVPEKKKHQRKKALLWFLCLISVTTPPVVSITWNFSGSQDLILFLPFDKLGISNVQKTKWALLPSRRHFAEVSRWNHTAKSHRPRFLGENSNSVVSLALIAQLQMSKSLGLRRFTSFLRVYSSNSPKNDHHNPMFCLMSRCLGLKKQKPYKPSTKTLESTSHLFWWMMLGTIYPDLPQLQRPTAQNHGSSLPILWLQLHPSETADDLGNRGQPIVVSGGATLDLSNVLHSLQEICFGGNLIPKKFWDNFHVFSLQWGPVLYFHDFVGGESMGWNVFTYLISWMPYLGLHIREKDSWLQHL